MIRAVTRPSGPTVVPRLCSANSPDRCNVLGSIRSTLLGGLISRVKAVNTIVRKGKKKAFRGITAVLSDTKRAVVTLEDGQSIDVTTGL